MTVSRMPSAHRPATTMRDLLPARSRHVSAAMTEATRHAYRTSPLAAASANGPRARSLWVPTSGRRCSRARRARPARPLEQRREPEVAPSATSVPSRTWRSRSSRKAFGRDEEQHEAEQAQPVEQREADLTRTATCPRSATSRSRRWRPARAGSRSAGPSARRASGSARARASETIAVPISRRSSATGEPSVVPVAGERAEGEADAERPGGPRARARSRPRRGRRARAAACSKTSTLGRAVARDRRPPRRADDDRRRQHADRGSAARALAAPGHAERLAGERAAHEVPVRPQHRERESEDDARRRVRSGATAGGRTPCPSPRWRPAPRAAAGSRPAARPSPAGHAHRRSARAARRCAGRAAPAPRPRSSGACARSAAAASGPSRRAPARAGSAPACVSSCWRTFSCVT